MVRSTGTVSPGRASLASGVHSPSRRKRGLSGSNSCQPIETGDFVSTSSRTAMVCPMAEQAWRPILHIEPAWIAVANRTFLSADCIDTVAAQVRREFVLLQQVQHPFDLRVRLVMEGAGLEEHRLKSSVEQQTPDLFRSVLAIVARICETGI